MVKQAEQQRAETIIVDGLACVTRRVFYIDTIVVLLRHKLAPWDLDELRLLNQEDKTRRWGRVLDFELTKSYPWTEADYLQSIVLHQPTNKAFSFLAATSPGWMVCRFDFALDLIVPNAASAKQVHELLAQHLTQPWHGSREVGIGKDADNVIGKEDPPSTHYFGARSSKRNVALYSDLPSKVTGGFAVHVEARTSSANHCRGYGLSRPLNFEALDPCSVFSSHMRLKVFYEHRLRHGLVSYMRTVPRNWQSNYLRKTSQRVGRIASMMTRIIRLAQNAADDATLEDLQVQRILEFVTGKERSPMKEAVDDALADVSLEVLLAGTELHLHDAQSI